MSAYPPPPSPEPNPAGGTPPVDPYAAPAGAGATPPPDAGASATPPPGAPAPGGWAAPAPSGYPGATPGGFPGQPAPSPYYGAPAPAGTDGVSIAALVTGIVGLGPVALILGIIGVRRTSKTGQGGKGMAIAGIVLGALTTIGWTILLLLLTIFATNDDVRDAFEEGLQQGWEQEAGFDVGACLNIPDDAGNIGQATEADCAGEHTAEVIATTQLTDDEFPGDDSVMATADEFCVGEFGGYVGAEFDASTLDLYYGLPTSTSWALGDRQIVCYVTPTDGSSLTGSVAGSGQ